MQGTREDPGMIPLAINHIYKHLQDTKQLIMTAEEAKVNPTFTANKRYTLKVSYLEIYNEVITDLVNPENTHLKIHESLSVNFFKQPD